MLALPLLFSCNDEVIPQTDLSLEGIWAPQMEGSRTDRYLEFRMGKCYTYFSPKFHYVGEGRIWGCGLDDFALLTAEDYYLEGGCLVLNGKNVGRYEKLGDGRVKIGNDVFIPVRELSPVTSKDGSITQLTIIYQGKPVHDGGSDFVLQKYCGDTDEFSLVITPSDAVDKDVFWYSDSPEVVSVTQDGTLSANGNGEAWINVYSKANLDVRDSCLVRVSTDLSRLGTANCYIASRSGHYEFDAGFKGNSTVEAISGITAAKLLWATYNSSVAPKENEFISNVSFNESLCRISFDLEFGAYRGGNAVIAAVDASGTVLWSWHIWALKGFNPDYAIEIYVRKDFESWPVSMDRNLGALSATPGSGNESFGLFYQWGRKDPFLPAVGRTDHSPVGCFQTIPWNTLATSAEYGTAAFATANPTTFVAAGTNTGGNWLWDASASSSRWSPDAKTVNDPCPPGWCLPGIDVWRLASEAAVDRQPEIDRDRYGIIFRNLVWSTGGWYPASGFLDESPDKVEEIGEVSCVYSADMPGSGADAGYPSVFTYRLSNTPEINYSGHIKAAAGCQVRCVAEKFELL